MLSLARRPIGLSMTPRRLAAGLAVLFLLLAAGWAGRRVARRLAARIAPAAPAGAARRPAPAPDPLPVRAFALPRQAGVSAGAPSPTGRNPKLLWTPEQQAVWDRMRKDNHRWYRLLKETADRTGTKDARYGDYGQWATIMYQVTGDRAYAEKAWHQMNHSYNGGSFLGTKEVPNRGSDFTREHFMDFVWIYDWLYPALSPDRRKLYLDTLNFWAEASMGKVPAFRLDNGAPVVWDRRLADSDQTTGDYFALVLLDFVTDNNRHADPEVGGLVSDGPNLFKGMRNAIRHYAHTARGGVWPESTEYNLGTMRLIFQGAQAVRMFTGKDHFPELTQFQRDAALGLLVDLSPDLKANYEWGDVQDIRTLHMWKRITLLGMLTGILQEDGDMGAHMHQMLDELAAKYPAEATPWPAFYLFYNPYVPKKDWRGQVPLGQYAPGMGLLLYHNGWKETDSLFGAHMLGLTEVDHEHAWFGDFQLYRRGEWAITRSVGYGQIHADTINGMLIGGLSSSRGGVRGPVAQESAPDGSYAYLAGTTAGPYYDKYYGNPPPAFLHEWTRSLVYLTTRDRTSDTIVVYDRTNAENPRSLPKFDRYHEYDRPYVDTFKNLKEWVLHARARPSEGVQGMEWRTPGGQQCRLTPLLPAERKVQVLDETTLWPKGYPYPQPSERAWQVRLSPAAERRWDTFLNVVQVTDGVHRLSSELVRDSAGRVEGVVLHRQGQDDAVLLFGSRQEARVVKDGYTVEWTAAGAATDLYLLDLDAAKSWRAAVDGGAGASLRVSEAGLGKLRVPGVGRHSLRVF